MTNIEVFMQTLPIIGASLLGIFGVTAFMILTVYLLQAIGNIFTGGKRPD